jgi:flagellar biosynthetic protein FliQ
MDSHVAIDWARQALWQCLVIGGPILAVMLFVGLIVAVFQTVTNVHDYSVAFIPKLMAVVLALALCLPWMIGKLASFSQSALTNVPAARRVDRSP